MIQLTNLSVITDEEETKGESLSESFGNGVSRLPYGEKKKFDCLSFAFSDIVSGSLVVNGVEINAAEKQSGRIYELSVSVNEVANVIAVFSLPKGLKDSLTIQRDIGKKVRELKEMPTKSLEEKKAKLSSLISVFSANNVAYVLVDLNDPLNSEYESDILGLFANAPLPTIVLEKKPAEIAIFKIIPKRDVPLGENGVLAFFKAEYLSYLFVSVFSLLASFGGFAAACLLGSGQILGGTISAIIAFLCFAMDFVVIASFYQSFLKSVVQELDYIKAEIISGISTCLGLAVGLGLSYLFSKNGIMISSSSVTPLAVVIATAVSALLLIASFASRPLYLLIERVSKLLRR